MLSKSRKTQTESGDRPEEKRLTSVPTEFIAIFLNVNIRLPGGDTPICKLYGDVPPFSVWFFDCPLINRVSNSKISEDFL